MLMQNINDWFDRIQQSADEVTSADPMAYIEKNSSITNLPDHSRSPSDLIVLIAARSSREGLYDIYTRSLPGGQHIASSFSFPDDYPAQEHSHNYIELAFVLNGSMHIRFENHTETFETGEICLIKRGILHSDLLKRDNSIILYLGIADSFFDKTLLADFASHTSEAFIRDIIVKKRMEHDFVRFIPKHISGSVPRLYLNILEEFYCLKPGYVRLIQGYSERILCLLPAEYQVSLTKIEHKEYLYHVYQDVKSYIEAHYDTVTTTELSQIFGYGPDYFNRLIKRFSQKSYTELLQGTRIKAAASLLETTKLSVEAVSQLVGYSNLGFFYRTFRAAYHCTPKEYRRKMGPEHRHLSPI
ncbi:MAG: AraC family transcriptional regulator [Eubacteriales bacterium]|nr:AraC family transcriptional regulator [Eubacteriales bacterium]